MKNSQLLSKLSAGLMKMLKPEANFQLNIWLAMHVLWGVQSGQCGANDDTSAPGLRLSCCLREWMACWKSLYKKQILSGLFHYLFPSSLEEKALYKDTHQIFPMGVCC